MNINHKDYTESNQNNENQEQKQSLIKKSLGIIGIASVGMTGITAISPEAQATTSTFVNPNQSVRVKPSVKIEPPRISKPLKTKSRVKIARPQISVPSPTQAKNNYLDTNRYSRRQPQPKKTPRVILSNRSSGSSTVVRGRKRINTNTNRPTRIVRRQSQNKKFSKARYSRNTNQYRSYSRNNTYASNGNYNYNPAPIQTVPLEYSHATRNSVVPANSNTSLLYPLTIPSRISSTFGWRIHPITGSRRMHSGTDISAPMGTPVLAAYPGQVAIADKVGGYGNTIMLRHENGTQESRYAHLSQIFVNEGEWVEQGAVIGLVGSTGFSTGPHLHFEWRHLTKDGWVAVDSGLHLQFALDNLIESMKTAKSISDSQPQS